MIGFQFKLLIWVLGFNFSVASHSGNKETKCLDCHNEKLKLSVVHPVAEGCDNCHNATGKTHPGNDKGFTLAQKVPDLCLTCHPDKIDTVKAPFTHKALLVKNSCVNCHSPHSSTEKKLLLKEEKTLCLSCHNKSSNISNRKSSNIKELVEKKHIHPALEGGCISCHSPHGADNSKLLIDKFPTEIYPDSKKENFALCYMCHDGGVLESDTTTTLTSFRNGNKNLHFTHIHGPKGRTCVFCHNPHGSNNEHLIEDFVYFGSWKAPMNYKPVATGGSCAPACHAEKKYVR